VESPQLRVRSPVAALLRHVPAPSRNGLVDTKSVFFLLKGKGINKARMFLCWKLLHHFQSGLRNFFSILLCCRDIGEPQRKPVQIQFIFPLTENLPLLTVGLFIKVNAELVVKHPGSDKTCRRPKIHLSLE